MTGDPDASRGGQPLPDTEPVTLTWRQLVSERWFVLSSLTAGIFLFTFLVYWFLGPQESPYIHHVNQANNFLHGHLDLKEEYSRNLNTLEAAYYDGKTYMTHPPMPAIVLLPFVAVSGLDTNQALISAVIGALTAALAFRIFRGMVSVRSAVWLTVMFAFGSVFWYIAVHGGIWYFSHTVGLLFLMLAVYFTITVRNPLAAGLCLGAAFLSRLPMGLAFPFFLIMLSDLPPFTRGTNTREWIADSVRRNFKALAGFSAGAGLFVLIYLIFNYLRFDDPFEGGHGLSPQVSQDELSAVYSHGIQDVHYIPRHVRVMFEQMPLFSKHGSYVWPSWNGTAIWFTTPALLYALFPNIRDRRIAIGGAVILAAACAVILSRALARVYWPSLGWDDVDFPLGSHLLPFWIMLVLAITLAVRYRDRLAVACWAAVLPVGLFLFMFAATGWTQFGYRYATDFYPFLFLLVARAVGDRPRWDMRALILLGVAVNLWGVLWIYQFDQHKWLSDFLPAATDGWTWVSF